MSARLDAHLATWLGQWPPTEALVVTTAPSRTEPGWDGQVHPVIGVSRPDATVLSVPPAILTPARRLAAEGGVDALSAGLGPLLGRPGDRLQAGTFRWCDEPVSPAVLADAGTWMAYDDPRVPAWLHPFGGEVLIALYPSTEDHSTEDDSTEDDSAEDGGTEDGATEDGGDQGRYAAGVGIKRHDRYGWELAVGTEARFAGRGLGRRLVAQAARRVVAGGVVATYLHDPRNIASAKVAEAAGFPDRGWQVLGLWP